MCRNRPYLCMSLPILLVCCVYVGEVGVHYIYSWTWAWPTHSVLPTHDPLDATQEKINRNFNVLSDETDDSKQTTVPTKILVISDPHIQCTFDLFEPWLYRWDSDKYLQRGFGRLLGQLQPDMVVVLGDLFAEGYKASDLYWVEYLECMRNILAVPSEVRLVVLPGDNDIGGEGKEGMKTHINQRYISEFGPLNEVVRWNGITLVKLNTVSYIHGHPVNEEEKNVRQETSAFLKVVAESTARELLQRPVILFSHVPLSELQHSVLNDCLSSIGPDYHFCGHIHRERHTHYTYTTVDGRDREAREWCVPTSSYRMGEASMGVGAIFIDCKGQLGYSVLWLPPRYPILLSYLLLALIVSSLLIFISLPRPLSRLRCCFPS